MTKPIAARQNDLSTCPSCGNEGGAVFYEVSSVPTSVARLIHDRDIAISEAKGSIRLRLCDNCGFIWNEAFDPDLVAYEEDYEGTQTASPTFNRFHERLARDLINRFGLSNKRIVEVGCGQGEFLSLLCELGGNMGTGFDPAYRSGPVGGGIKIFTENFSPAHAGLECDFLCCKMTLEHISDVGKFLGMLRQATDGSHPLTLFLQVPDVTRILRERAFWDIYYEHCSYFSPGSLARCVRQAGFAVSDAWRGYGDQYVMVAAHPGADNDVLPTEDSPADLSHAVAEFSDAIESIRSRCESWLRNCSSSGRRVVLWGGGSKAVGCLTTLAPASAAIEYVVDINPQRAETFVAGTGQETVAPDVLKTYKPDLVVVMNPIYLEEIRTELASMDLDPILTTIERVATGGLDSAV